jgi:TonB family protein
LVANRIVEPAIHARALVKIAEALSSASHSHTAPYSLCIFDSHSLEERVMRLTDFHRIASIRRSAAILVLAAIFLGATAMASASFAVVAAGQAELSQGEAPPPNSTVQVVRGQDPLPIYLLRAVNTAEAFYRHQGKTGRYATLEELRQDSLFKERLEQMGVSPGPGSEFIPGFTLNLIVSPDGQYYMASLEQKDPCAISYYTSERGLIQIGFNYGCAGTVTASSQHEPPPPETTRNRLEGLAEAAKLMQHEPPPPGTMRIRVGEAVEAGKLIERQDPVYPPLAMMARISGVVKLSAVIAKDGTVQDLNALSGHPLLVKSAMEVVQHWRYQPTLLNGKPVEVMTTIAIPFKLEN